MSKVIRNGGLKHRSKIIIVRGCACTGKSSLAERYCKVNKHTVKLNVDMFKTKLYNLYGFNSIEERERLSWAAFQEFTVALKAVLQSGTDVIIEHPFRSKHKFILLGLIQESNYIIKEVCLYGDVNKIHERYLARIYDPNRNLALDCSRFKSETDCDLAPLKVESMKSTQDEILNNPYVASVKQIDTTIITPDLLDNIVSCI